MFQHITKKPCYFRWLMGILRLSVSQSKVGKLKTLLDETKLYESLELFEYMSW